MTLRRIMKQTRLPPEVLLDLALEMLDIASRKLSPSPIKRQAVGLGAQAEVQTRRLNLPIFDRQSGRDGAFRHELPDLLMRENAGLARSGRHRSS